MNKIPRRIVTGIQNGKSVIIEDGSVSNVVEHVRELYISDTRAHPDLQSGWLRFSV